MANSRHFGVSRDAEIEKAKIIFQFVLMIVASFIGGILFARLLSDTAIDKLSQNVISHFSLQLRERFYIGELIEAFFKVCRVDVACVIILFVFSFSFVNYIVTDIVLIFCGFRVGINVALMYSISLSNIGYANSIIFFIFKAILIATLLFYACKMAISSLHLRRFSENGRMIADRRLLASVVLFAATVLGLTLIIDGLYCLLIYIF